MLERMQRKRNTLESTFDSKEIKPVNPKGNQPWIFIGQTDVDAEALNTLVTLCEEPTHLKNLWYWERLKAGGEGMTENEMVGWHHWVNRHEFEQTPGIREWTGKPGVLQSMGSQRVGHNWVTELNWILRISALSVVTSHFSFLIWLIWSFSRKGLWGRWLSHEGEALMNRISALIRETPRDFSCPFCHVRIQWEDSHLWTRKQVYTRHQIYWCLDLGLYRPQICEK